MDPQVGQSNQEKDIFSHKHGDIIRAFSREEIMHFWGDLSVLFGRYADGYEGLHGGYGYGTRNHEKSEVLDLRHDSVVQNLRKRKTRVIFFCVFSSETLQLA